MESGSNDIYKIFNNKKSEKDKDGSLQIYSVILGGIKEKICNVGIIGSDESTLTAFEEYLGEGKVISINGIDEKIKRSVSYATIDVDLMDDDKIGKEIPKMSVIIDDSDVDEIKKLKQLRNLFCKVEKGGIYIIEGIEREGKIVSHPGIIGIASGCENYFFVGIENKKCIIQKIEGVSMRRIY